MYGEVVDGIDAHRFEQALTDLKKRRGAAQDVDLGAQDLGELLDTYRQIYRDETGRDFVQDPREQLTCAVRAVFESWEAPRAKVYRRRYDIPDDLGTAVNVVQTVFGNKGEESGTGVAFTRDPSTGEPGLYGEFLANAQGEDVVAGIRTPEPLAAMQDKLPAAFEQLLETMRRLEEHYHDIGKWMFSFTFFWAYTAFSQFMLQWYGNMPEETVWYKYRMFGDWQWVSIAILVGYWAFPFVFLMSRWTKRIVPSLVFFSVWQLVFHWLDLYWNAMPSYDWHTTHVGSLALNAGPLSGPIELHHVGFSGVDIMVWIAMIGVLMVGIGRNLKGNLIPVKDPTLGLSLAHEQL